MADGAIAVPSQASFGGPATQERSGPVSFASGMITHCQIMGQEPRIALTDPWLSLLLASADVVLPCTLAAPHPLTPEWLGGRHRERPALHRPGKLLHNGTTGSSSPPLMPIELLANPRGSCVRVPERMASTRDRTIGPDVTEFDKCQQKPPCRCAREGW